jgi:hypothetical protein
MDSVAFHLGPRVSLVGGGREMLQGERAVHAKTLRRKKQGDGIRDREIMGTSLGTGETGRTHRCF